MEVGNWLGLGCPVMLGVIVLISASLAAGLGVYGLPLCARWWS